MALSTSAEPDIPRLLPLWLAAARAAGVVDFLEQRFLYILERDQPPRAPSGSRSRTCVLVGDLQDHRPRVARRAPRAVTRTVRPTYRRQCSGKRTGRSNPGEETCSEVPATDAALTLEPLLQGPAHPGAVVRGDASARAGCPGGRSGPGWTGAAAGPTSGTRSARIPDRRRGGGQPRAASRQPSGRAKKNVGELPHIDERPGWRSPLQRGKYRDGAGFRQSSRAPRADGSTGIAQVRHHPPVPAAGGPVAVEGVPVVARAPL